MKKLLLLLLPLTAQAAPIDFVILEQSVKPAMNQVVLQKGQTIDGFDVIFAKWQIISAFGTWNYCSITRIDDLLFLITGKTMTATQLGTAKTPNGILWSWNPVWQQPPANINQWCLQ